MYKTTNNNSNHSLLVSWLNVLFSVAAIVVAVVDSAAKDFNPFSVFPANCKHACIACYICKRFEEGACFFVYKIYVRCMYICILRTVNSRSFVLYPRHFMKIQRNSISKEKKKKKKRTQVSYMWLSRIYTIITHPFFWCQLRARSLFSMLCKQKPRMNEREQLNVSREMRFYT